jgi:uncharacterized protein (TIGR03437 family)
MRDVSVPLVDSTGSVASRYSAACQYFTDDLGGGVSLDMAVIPGGSFSIGSSAAAPSGQPSEQPVHAVAIDPLCLGTGPVTRGQWRRVSLLPRVSIDLAPIYRLDMPLDVENQLPIDVVQGADAYEFCARLQAYTGRLYRLPCEAEWEYACRAGTDTKYHFGDAISLDVANFNDLQRPLTLTPAGSKNAPNRFGLNDMHGNVLEWCTDTVHGDYTGAPTSGTPWVEGGDPLSRVVRGGMYLWDEERARSAARTSWDLRETASGMGFRVALAFPGGPRDPVFGSSGVVNAAQYSSGTVCPGELIAIFGRDIGPAEPAFLTLTSDGRVSKELGGTSLSFDGTAAPMLYVSKDQINAVVPYAIAGQAQTKITLTTGGQTSAPVTVAVVISAPAIFSSDGSGRGEGAILNQDQSHNSAGSPAARGSVVSFYCTGAGLMNPAQLDGQIAGPTLVSPVLPVELTIGGLRADVIYAGSAPGLVSGVIQVNAQIPSDAPSGLQSAQVLIGDKASPEGIVVAIR